MVEQSYGEWDTVGDQYAPDATRGDDFLYYDPKTGKYYGTIQAQRYRGSSRWSGRSKYTGMQQDVYELDESELDAFRAFHKKWNKGKMRKKGRGMSGDAKKFRRARGSGEGSDVGPGDKRKEYEAGEQAWWNKFSNAMSSYRSELGGGSRGSRRKVELQKRDLAQKRYADQMYDVQF